MTTSRQCAPPNPPVEDMNFESGLVQLEPLGLFVLEHYLVRRAQMREEAWSSACAPPHCLEDLTFEDETRMFEESWERCNILWNLVWSEERLRFVGLSSYVKMMADQARASGCRLSATLDPVDRKLTFSMEPVLRGVASDVVCLYQPLPVAVPAAVADPSHASAQSYPTAIVETSHAAAQSCSAAVAGVPSAAAIDTPNAQPDAPGAQVEETGPVSPLLEPERGAGWGEDQPERPPRNLLVEGPRNSLPEEQQEAAGLPTGSPEQPCQEVRKADPEMSKKADVPKPKRKRKLKQAASAAGSCGPEKVKRWRTGYMMFMVTEAGQVRKDSADGLSEADHGASAAPSSSSSSSPSAWSPGSVSKKMGRIWASMTPAQKEPYMVMSREDKLRYEKEVRRGVASTSSSDPAKGREPLPESGGGVREGPDNDEAVEVAPGPPSEPTGEGWPKQQGDPGQQLQQQEGQVPASGLAELRQQDADTTTATAAHFFYRQLDE